MLERPRTRLLALAGAAVLCIVLVAWPDAVVAAWRELVGLIAVEGEPVPASPAFVSEHEIEELDVMPPQAQAERLLERAINHYGGATSLIAKRVDGWRGKLELDGSLSSLYTTAFNANDLRVRAAALEIYLAANGLEKSPDTLDRMMERGDEQAEGRPFFLWVVGVLGNRGVDPDRVLDYLRRYAADPDLETRRWAVDGMAVLGTSDAIVPLLGAFHDDLDPTVRERAACGLAQSGMFTEAQRWTALPELIRFADDPALDPQTRKWVFHALSDISGLRLGNDASEWRSWWARGPRPRAPEPA